MGGKERERVEVAVRVRRQPDPEVDVRDRVLAIAARADRSDRLALAENRVGAHRDRAQMDECDGVAVGRSHGHGSTSARDGAGEAHGSCGRRAHGRSRAAGNVDSSVLPSGIRVVSENEWS